MQIQKFFSSKSDNLFISCGFRVKWKVETGKVLAIPPRFLIISICTVSYLP